MTYDEMQLLIKLLQGAFPRLTDGQVDTYSEMLVMEDRTVASQAILEGIQVWKHPPAWAEIKEAIRAVRVRTPARPQPEESFEAEEMPEWVKRWLYARFIASPPDMRPFKEQSGLQHGEPRDGWMPEEAYAEEAKAVTPAMVRQVFAARDGVLT